MTDREQYTPGPASGAQVRKDGEKWTLILVTVGTTVKLTAVGAPAPADMFKRFAGVRSLCG